MYGINNWCSIRAAAMEVKEETDTFKKSDILKRLIDRKPLKSKRKKEHSSKRNIYISESKNKRNKESEIIAVKKEEPAQIENVSTLKNQIKITKELVPPEKTIPPKTPLNKAQKSTGRHAHSEGLQTKADGIASHAEGLLTQATSAFAHAEGSQTKALGHSSHSEGSKTTASGHYSHAEGKSTIALGDSAHAEGTATVADGFSSHAEGIHTSTASFAGTHIMGRFGSAEQPYSWFIANGTNQFMPGLGAKWLAHNGEMYIDGACYNASGTDYAQMFETVDRKTIDIGYFVTFDTEEKIRKANANDSFILGVSSATPLIIGNSAALSWNNRYVTDEWGQRKYTNLNVSAKTAETQPIINSAWDPNCKYTPRRERPEWLPVGLVGQILVRDDGTCETHGYCRPNDEGIATKTTDGYFVIKRNSPNQILILFR